MANQQDTIRGLEGAANTQNTTDSAPSPATAILQTSRLLTLPPEVRNTIYHLVLVREGRKRVLAPALPYDPALLRTCRQIRQEAQGIFLHQNTFYITVYNLHYTIPRTHWFHSVAPQNRSVVLARQTKKMQWGALAGLAQGLPRGRGDASACAGEHEAAELSEAEEEAGEHNFYEEATYDPAYSALDRDAARFALITQTQGLRPYLHGNNDRYLDDESLQAIAEEPLEDHSLDEEEYTAAHQLSHELSAAANAVVPSSQPGEQTRNASTRIKDSQPSAAGQVTSSELVPIAHVSTSHPQDAAGEDEERIPSSPPPAPLAKPSLTVAKEAEPALQPDSPGVLQQEEERVPSSPPPLRASQVSTVVPTQYSLTRPASRRAGATQTQWSFRSPLKTTRSRSQEEMMMMGSSSPVQLPPWSSPERARYTARMEAGGGTGELVMGSMMDFSLPPPPPISSSRVGTQSGGRSSPPLPI
ncbi:hypothetical protein LTS01_018628 [Friedmanniomyces endolithicus]|nr:hypothetical protein LTS01_018628 [Friedmanniomyces endolithicus]